jgi:hypothetical protein
VTRFLLIAALVVFVLVAVRRAFAAGQASQRRVSSRPRVRGSRPPEPGEGALDKAPEFLVCGGCGHGFDPEESGWICPRCGK